MKKRNFLFICTFLSLCICACASTPKEKKVAQNHLAPDSLIIKELGNSLTTLLYSPKQVKCYHISKKKEIKENEIQPIKGFVRDTLISKLDAGQTAILQFLLINNRDSYSKDSIAIEAPNIPELEFEFSAGRKKIASIIISTSNRRWQVIYDGKKQFECYYADAKSLERFCQYFITNYYNNKPKTNKH